MTGVLAPWQRLALALASGALMAIAFLHADFYVLAWFAFAPLLLAVHGTSLFRAYLLGLAAGLVFCMMAAYWLTDFLVIARNFSPGLSLAVASAIWFGAAQAWALLALAFTALRRLTRQWPLHDFVLFPLVLVAVFSIMPMLFPFHPAQTQSHFLSALQAIEITGMAGLDALIGLVNAMVYRLLLILRARRADLPAAAAPRVAPILPWCLAAALILGWFGYGAITTRLWDQRLASWDTITIGMVQPNEVPQLTRPRPYPGYSLAHPPAMAMTRRLADAGAELVVWPEARYQGYFDNAHVRTAYSRQLRDAGTHLLFQDTEHDTGADGEALQYNSAMLIRNDGQAQAPYRKMKTIPFGESAPLAGAIPFIDSLAAAVLGDFGTRISPGTTAAAYDLGNATVVPLICYETVFPGFVAAALPADTTATLLVGVSSNGWFGNTREPYQHAHQSILRAVENRVPFVHVLNNGPSVVALPNGRILFQSDPRQAGGYLVEVPYRAPATEKRGR